MNVRNTTKERLVVILMPVLIRVDMGTRHYGSNMAEFPTETVANARTVVSRYSGTTSTVAPFSITCNLSTNCSHQVSTQGVYTSNDGVKGFLASIMVLFSSSAIVANLLVIITIIFTRRLRTITSAFLINLSVCDFFVGAIIMPLTFRNIVQRQVTYSQVGFFF